MFDVACSVLPFALLLFSGCATTPKHHVPMTGNIMVDGPNMIAEGPPKDKVLWQYRTAAAAMRQGQFDVAKPLLDDALLTLGGIYGKDAEARKSRGYFSREARKTFIGEPYERAMAYFYRGVIYWMDGEPDNARACFRSAEFEDSDAENEEYAGDWVLPEYLDGLATTKLGNDGADALKRAQANGKEHQPAGLQPEGERAVHRRVRSRAAEIRHGRIWRGTAVSHAQLAAGFRAHQDRRHRSGGRAVRRREFPGHDARRPRHGSCARQQGGVQVSHRTRRATWP